MSAFDPKRTLGFLIGIGSAIIWERLDVGLRTFLFADWSGVGTVRRSVLNLIDLRGCGLRSGQRMIAELALSTVMVLLTVAIHAAGIFALSRVLRLDDLVSTSIGARACSTNGGPAV